MKYIITILLFLPLLAQPQGAIVDAAGNLIPNFIAGCINETKGADIASSGTTNIGAATGNYVDITGTTTITGFGTVQAGTRRILRFTGVLTLTHNATSLILPGGANITTAAGDVFQFTSLGSGNWRCIAYLPATMTGTGGYVGPTSPSISNATFTGTTSGITATMVGLGNVTNESKATMFSSPTFTGTTSGITSTMVGLGNVTNESKATMFTSPTFTGTPVGIGLPVYGRVTGSNVTTTGQTLVDAAGLSVALAINATYEFEANLSVSTTAVTTGTQYGIQYSVAGGAIEAQVTGAFTSTASKTERVSALNTASTAFLTTSAQTGGVRITGIVTTGANAGNLTVRHLKVTSGTSTIFINSFIKVTRIL